ncbi:tetratricopeptide repeat protein [Coralliovum pocilloporae]|uniref:tetratricopeptide repeat protein n=1 Tax=Coralliovum pocilloporae TaxID=3066369 RepID=UPI003307C25C
MPTTDMFGYEISLDDKAALSSWNSLVFAFLAHSAETPVHLEALFKRLPDAPMGHVMKGFFCLLLGRRELVETAAATAAKVTGLRQIGALNERESLYADALNAWLSGRPTLSAELMDRILARWPADAVALKLGHGIRFILGDSKGMLTSIEAVQNTYGTDHPAFGYVQGCRAFALEECGRQTEAEQAGILALQHARDDAWGLHAVAHVYDMTGRADTGVTWLSSQPEAWQHCNNFGYHVWWHLALFHLDRREFDVVLDLYDRHVRKDQSDDYRDISNGASMLMRLELEGVDVGNRWEEMAAISEGRTEDGCVVFADLHYLLALMGGDRTDSAKTLVNRIRRDAVRHQTDMDQVAHTPGIAAAIGIQAFMDGDNASAFTHLKTAYGSMQRIGGSHAQRDVFDRLTIEAAIRSGQIEDANRLLEDRVNRRGGEDGYTRTRASFIAQLGRVEATA